MTLRVRLLTSHLLLLVITLSVFIAAFLLAISSDPAPPNPTYQQLAALSRGLDLDILEFQNSQSLQSANFAELLDNFAETRNVRVLAMRVRQNAPAVTLYDSARSFQRGDQVQLRIDNYQVTRLGPLFIMTDTIFGAYQDGDQEWLFSGVTHADISIGGQQVAVVVSTERPTQSLQRALAEFDTALANPLLRAGIVGLVVAVLLAFLITRTIAHPLQAASAAATAVAKGNFDQSVPVSGPTEVRAVAEAFNQMSGEVRATQQAQHDFMANVSHDLKTPLTSIQGYSQAIIDGTAKNPARAAEIIYDEATRLNRLVIDLTDLAQIQTGKFSMHITPIDIGQIAATVADNLSVVAERKGVKLTADTPAIPQINGDGDRLVQVFNNLISNAIKYTPKGGQIQVQTRENGAGVEIVVRDTGIGIPQPELPRIFERFYQVDKSRGPSRGTGLGLAITYEIVQAHRGRIDVQSAEGQGTTFTVWLPRS